MRLLKREKSGWLAGSYTFSLTEYKPNQTPSYAILSHRWGPDEVTFKDISSGIASKDKSGYKKLKFCGKQAAQDGLLYFWVDTCCIDRTSSAELQEAINSMFKWYKNATKCYVYLPDVSAEGDWEGAFQKSEWFTRGWTLQELLAPSSVDFFSVEGRKLGDKQTLERQIHQITGISIEALKGKLLSEIDEQERLSWTVRRQTTIEEDAVYCLLGIFDIHMSLIYGEGRQNALARLQRKIQRSSRSISFVAKDAPWIVPFERNPRFTGRESQLAELEGCLFAKDHTSRIAITGLGGIGKTQLVLELLYKTKQQHPNCTVMWIPATTTDILQQGYLTVAQQLGISGYEDENADVKGLVQDYLSKKDHAPWVLVFDNADDIEIWTATPSTRAQEGTERSVSSSSSPPPRLLDYLPQNQKGCIIFTTRDKKAAVKLAQQNIVTVSAMSEEAASQLLKKSLYDSNLVNDSQDESALLEALTYLPLAITQAAAYINANGISLGDYTSLLEDREEAVIDILSENFEDFGRYQDVKNPIATTWLISFEQIRRVDPLAAEYLSFMACIHYRDIPQTLLPSGTSRKKEIDAIGTLLAYSFVTRRPSSASLDLHRLVHVTTRNWLRKEESLRERMKQTAARLDEVFPDDEHNNRATWRSYLPHVHHILASISMCPVGESRLGLMIRYGKCLNRDGRFTEAEAVFREVLALIDKDPDEEGEVIPHTLNSLALTYADQGRLAEAERLQLQVMAIRKTKFGLDHPGTLTSMNNLATTYGTQGRLREAEALHLEIMQLSKAKPDPDDPHNMISMDNLAMIYGQLGRLEEAEQLQMQVLNINRTKLGADHPDTLTTMNNLAITYSNQGRFEEALQFNMQILETRKVRLGAAHPKTMISMYNLAYTYHDLGRNVEAIQLMRECATLRGEAFGAAHPDTASPARVLEVWEAGLARAKEEEPEEPQSDLATKLTAIQI